jgi:hypothetical protein
MSTVFLLKFFGILTGVLARTLLPWLRKLREGQALAFGRRYLYSALASLLIGVILTLVIFPKLDAEAGDNSFETLFKLFCLAFGFGFGWNALVLEGEAWAGTGRPGDRKAGPPEAAE